jgi:hypothetical protein
MPQQIVEDSIWKDRIEVANRLYKKWESQFACEVLEKYYEGKQWANPGTGSDRKYVINKIYETIQIKLDSFIPTFPRYLVFPRAGASDYDLETAAISAQLKQDVLNTIVSNENEVFSEEIGMAYKDSFFRFGVIEVGYAADWILNPNAPKPLLNTDTSKQTQKPKIKKEPPELPVNERIYFKHIPARTFRIGGMDHKYLHRCGWCGYYEWVDKNDLLALRGLKNRSKLETIVGYGETSSYSDNSDRPSGSYIKIWHIWDNKSKMRLVVVDSPCVTISEKKFKRLNLFDFRPDKSLITNSFYPIPPVYHWISPQDEINETREQLKNHRRRFVRKFQVLLGSVDDEEIEKFETGPDGALITVKRENAITPIQNAELGISLDKAIITSSDDLNQISGTSSEVRGVADRTTATQAMIINQRASVRENAERDHITKWLTKIGREILLIVRDKFTLGIWAQITSDNRETFLGEIQTNLPSYQWVTSEDLNDNYDFRIDVDVTTLSAAIQEIEKRKFIEFNSIITQFPHILLSPILVREAAYRVGYRNEKVIQEMKKMALLQQYAAMSGGMANPPGNASQNVIASNTPNDIEQVRNQIQNQLGLITNANS